MTRQDVGGEAEHLPGDYQGSDEEVQVAFNPRYLTEGVAAIEGDTGTARGDRRAQAVRDLRGGALRLPLPADAGPGVIKPPRDAPTVLPGLKCDWPGSDLADFRSYPTLHWEPDPEVNIVVGPNGAGKTNLLEAIGYLATMRSFRGVGDDAVVRSGEAVGRGERRSRAAGFHRIGRARDFRSWS